MTKHRAESPTGYRGLLARHRWLVFVLPMAVFLLVGSLEPTPGRPGGDTFGLAIPYAAYPLLYTIKIALTAATLVAVAPGYRGLPWRLTPWGVLVGLLGAGLWIGLCRLRLEERWLVPLGLGEILGLGTRSGFNPLAELADRPAWAWGFLVIRAVGLVAVVPVMEEVFLRAFVMRLVVAPEWWRVPFGQVTPLAVALGTLLPMLMHPAELVAAAAWFSLVTWLMVRTRSLGDCVAAHVLTNLLLGLYVLASGDWRLL